MVAGAGQSASRKAPSAPLGVGGVFIAGLLTALCDGTVMRCAFAFALCLMLAACSAAPDDGVDARALASDPVLARALHDPLMSDPDLSARNEANAVLGLTGSGALPVFTATPETSRAARDAARLELLEGGTIPDLPPASDHPHGKALGPLGALASAADLLAALGAPAECMGRLEEGFAWSADLPQAAAIMPHGMVVQAGGAALPPCRMRIIRYRTAAAPEDVLAYHYARAVRAGMTAARHAKPEDMIAASNAAGARLVVHVRPAANGMAAVDLLYRAS